MPTESWTNPYDKCYNQGYAGFWDGLGIADCPHAIFSPEEGHWMRGWAKAGVDSRRRKAKPKREPKAKDDPGFDLIED